MVRHAGPNDASLVVVGRCDDDNDDDDDDDDEENREHRDDN